MQDESCPGAVGGESTYFVYQVGPQSSSQTYFVSLAEYIEEGRDPDVTSCACALAFSRPLPALPHSSKTVTCSYLVMQMAPRRRHNSKLNLFQKSCCVLIPHWG